MSGYGTVDLPAGVDCMSLDQLLARFWSEIGARPHGPMAFRFFVQPAVATFFACRDGIRAARKGNPAYLWALLVWKGHRRELLREGWRSVGRVFMAAVVIDLLYEAFVLRGVRPLQAVFVGALLGVLPYVVLRGLVSRVARIILHRKQSTKRRVA
jgi:hypothetical protein